MSGMHPLSLSTQRNLRNALRAFCSKTIQFQVVSRGIAPLLNSRLISVLSHVVLLKATSEPRVGKDSQLFSRFHKRRIQMPLAPFLGIYPPVLARTLNLDVS